MFSFLREFFRTVFSELRRRLRRRRVRKEHELNTEVHDIREEERDRRKKAVHDELKTRRVEHAIKPRKVPDNPYTKEDEV